MLLIQLNGLSMTQFIIALPNFGGHSKLTYLHLGLTLRSLIMSLGNQIQGQSGPMLSLCIGCRTISMHFPPFILIAQCLQKTEEDQALGTIVVPLWPTQP